MSGSRGRNARFQLENLAYLGLLGFIGELKFLYEPLGWFHLFSFFFLFFLIRPVRVLWRYVRRIVDGRYNHARTDGDDARAWQDLKAMARFSLLGIVATTVNPFGLIQVVAQLGGQVLAYVRRLGRLPFPDTYRQRNRFSPPLDGHWAVVNGGIERDTSHSWELIGQRYAYDFVIMDAEGRTYRGEGKRPEDYYAFGQPILAPADGTVVRVRDGVRDYPSPLPRSGRIDWLTRDFRGNFVVIDHGHSEYSFLTHLQRASICVRLGENVKRGQRIGLCGNSGHSTEPHLHFHVQDHPDMFLAVSLPVRFSDFRFTDDPDGYRRSDAYLSKGQHIVTTPPATDLALTKQ